jgi:hypothetical protein
MFDNSKARTAELTRNNQRVCAEWYANARNGVRVHCLQRGWLSVEESAKYWQRSAEDHFIKTAHRMNLLQPMLQTCAYWQARVNG